MLWGGQGRTIDGVNVQRKSKEPSAAARECVTAGQRKQAASSDDDGAHDRSCRRLDGPMGQACMGCRAYLSTYMRPTRGIIHSLKSCLRPGVPEAAMNVAPCAPFSSSSHTEQPHHQCAEGWANPRESSRFCVPPRQSQGSQKSESGSFLDLAFAFGS